MSDFSFEIKMTLFVKLKAHKIFNFMVTFCILQVTNS